MVFFNIFLKTLGFLTGLAVFFIIFNLMLFFLPKVEDDDFILSKGEANSKNLIATLSLDGPIIKNSNLLINHNIYQTINPEDVKKSLNKLQLLNPDILIIKLNSPGGTVTATASLENILNKFKKNNDTKIYFFTEDLLASGGYWIATVGDRIYAQYGSIIGSIGVTGPSWYYYNKPSSISSGAFGNSIETQNGIEIFTQNAGNYKDLYNPFRKPSKKELDHLQSIVEDIYVDFINKVSSSRKIETDTIKNEIGGLIYSSKQAKNIFLIDDIKNFDELIDRIVKEEEFVDYKIIKKQNKSNFFETFILNYFNFNTVLSCEKFNNNFVSLMPVFLKDCN